MEINFLLVDMETGAGIIYSNDITPPFTGDFFDDYLHPNDSGYVKMNRVWFNKIKELLTPTLASPANDSINAPINISS